MDMALQNRFFPRCKDLPACATRIACAVFCADFLTMLLMNIGRLRTPWLPFLFFGLLGVLAFWILRGSSISSQRPGYISTQQQRYLTLLALIAALIVAGVRFPYLLEGHLRHLVGPIVYDDTWHFQEINSLVHSVRYPAHCSLIPSRYFSLYYAPWMMIAALYLAIPVYGFTIKVAFAIGCAIYAILIILTLLHIGIERAHDRKHLYWAIYLVAFWAGTESFFSFMYYLWRNPDWVRVSETPIHLPSLFLGILWAPHHLSAAVALILCWHIWDTSLRKNWPVIFVCCVLIAFAFYGSVFVFLGAIPFAIFYLWRTARTNYKALGIAICLSGTLIWPLLWIYLGKSQDIRFLSPFITGIATLFPYTATVQFQSVHPVLSSALQAFPGMAAGFMVFLAFIAANFLIHTIAILFRGRGLPRDTFLFAAIAILFIVSTYFIGFPEGDNYASRGSIIPIIVLGWICAGLLPEIRPKLWITLGLLMGAFGLLNEGISAYKNSFRVAQAPLSKKSGGSILEMNRNRKTGTVCSNAIAAALVSDPNLIYSIEKFVPGGKARLVVADRQLESVGPHGPWKWQQIPPNLDK